MRNPLLLLIALGLSSCVRSQGTRPAPIENDESIVFPSFSGADLVVTGAAGRAYELDGATLQALTVAFDDFMPSASQDGAPCWGRLDAYRYRVVRQGTILFIRISADPAACEHKFVMLDSGARYAISTEGRILRRAFTGEPDAAAPSAVRDAGVSEGSSELDLSPLLGPRADDLPSFLRSRGIDGGTSGGDAPRDGGASPDGGTPEPLSR